MALNMTLLQLHTEDAYIGRVMSIYFLQWGLAPAGSLLVGALAAGIGAPYAVATMGLLTAAFAIGVLVCVAPIRALDRSSRQVRSPRLPEQAPGLEA